MTSNGILPAAAGTVDDRNGGRALMAVRFTTAERRNHFWNATECAGIQDYLWCDPDAVCGSDPATWEVVVCRPPQGTHWYPQVCHGVTILEVPADLRGHTELAALPEMTWREWGDLFTIINGRWPKDWGDDSYLATDDKPHPFLLADLIPAQMVTLLTALPKSGKTTLLRGFLAAGADRRPYLGRATGRQRESYAGGLRAMVVTEEPARVWKGKVPPSVKVESRNVEPKFRKPADWDKFCDELNDHVDAYDFDLVVLDTIGGLVAFDENSPRAVGRVYEGIRRIRHGAAVLLLHHVSRSADGPVGSNARGSTAMAGEADACLELTQPYPDPDTRRKLAWVNRVGTHKGELVYRMAADGTLELADKAASLLAESAADIRGVRPAAGILDQLRGAR